VEELQAGVEETLTNVQKKVTDVIDTPARLQREAQQAVDKTIESFQKDDGRVLDQETPAGFVGSFAVSLAVLPYIPLSFYSTYLLYTTGKGLPAGPNGIYGLAEGVGTLVIFAVCIWSAVSFLTRARGLPAGAFNILGATQSLSYLAALALLATSLVKGSGSTLLAGLKGLQTPALPAVSIPGVSLPKTPDLPKFDGLGKDSSAFIEGLQKGLNNQVEGVKGKVSSVADKAKEAVQEATESATSAVGKVKVPDVKIPEVKVPDVKVPEVKVPEVKAPQVKAPEVKSKAPEAKEEAKVKAPAAKAKEEVNIEDLF